MQWCGRWQCSSRQGVSEALLLVLLRILKGRLGSLFLSFFFSSFLKNQNSFYRFICRHLNFKRSAILYSTLTTKDLELSKRYPQNDCHPLLAG